MSLSPKYIFAILLLIAIGTTLTVSVQAQDRMSSKMKAERKKQLREKKKRVFNSASWKPGYGIKLLNKKSTEKPWSKYTSKNSKCRPFAIKSTQYVIFRTEYLHILVYNYPNWNDSIWLICDRKTGEVVYGEGEEPHGEAFSETLDVIDALTDKDGRDLDQSMCYDAPATRNHFVRYSENGPLMFKVLGEGCRDGKERHEVVLYFDKNRVRPLPGSVIVEHNTHNAVQMGYFIRRHHETYKQWYEDGNLTWTRELSVSILGLGNDMNSDDIDVCTDKKQKHLYNCKDGELQRPIHEETCKFERAEMRVTCASKIIKRVELKSFLPVDDGWLTCGSLSNAEVLPCYIQHKEGLLDKANLFRKLGYDISEKVIEELEQNIKKLKKN